MRKEVKERVSYQDDESLSSVRSSSSSSSTCFCWFSTLSWLKSSLAGDCLNDLYSSTFPASYTSSCISANHTVVSSKDSNQVRDMLVMREPPSGPYMGVQNYLLNSHADVITDQISRLQLSQNQVERNVNDETNSGIQHVTSSRLSSHFDLNDPLYDCDIAYLPFVETSSTNDPGYGGSPSCSSSSTSSGCPSSSSFTSSNSSCSSLCQEDIEGGKSLASSKNLSTSTLFPSRPGSILADGGISLDVNYLKEVFPFISQGTMFTVNIFKDSRGLGLSVTGGVECEEMAFPGLIRVKKLYPETPAWLCGDLNVNDFILEANGVQLTGLTSHEALEILRASVSVELNVCRAPPGVLSEVESTRRAEEDMEEVGDKFESHVDTWTYNQYLAPSSSLYTCGEFEVQLTKVGGSLGFTLKKNDNSILGHTIRSLVREPALSDGRIRPGDKLLSVNGRDLCGFSHEQAVRFLRTCPETVVIRIYRDAIQTPVSPASPTEPEYQMAKPLRREALDFLSLLAFQKRDSLVQDSSSEEQTSTIRRRKLKNASPHSKNDGWENLVREAQESSGDLVHSEETNRFGCSERTTPTPNNDSRIAYSQSSFNHSSFPSSHHSDSLHSVTKLERPKFLDLSSSYRSRKPSFSPAGSSSQFPPYREFDTKSTCSPENAAFILDSSAPFSSTPLDYSSFHATHQPSGSRSLNDPGVIDASGNMRDSTLPATASVNDVHHSHLSESGDLLDRKNALLKWKDVVFTPDDSGIISNMEEDRLQLGETRMISLSLCRGWNSRLGFSLNSRANQTVVVAIHADSVAAKDGRLRVGDVVLEVNGVDVSSFTCDEVREEIRKTSRKINFKILRKKILD